MKQPLRSEKPGRGERCPCTLHVDTPIWVGARRTGSGLGAHGAAAHGNPWTGLDGCVHSDLIRTTRAHRRARRTVPRAGVA